MDENNQGLQWSHIEPLCILRALARQLWMLLLAALTCAMAAWIVLTCFVTQQYTSSTTFSVTTRTSNLYYTNITAAADVAASYSQLLQSRVLRQTMEQNLGMPLNGTVSAQQLGETNLIRVTVTADTPRQALVLLKAVSDNYGSLSAHVSSTAVLSQLNSPSLSVAPSRSYNVPRICLMAGEEMFRFRRRRLPPRRARRSRRRSSNQPRSFRVRRPSWGTVEMILASRSLRAPSWVCTVPVSYTHLTLPTILRV